MPTNVFINLPVKDLERSKQFWKRVGYTFHPQFTDENAASMVISDTIYAMLLTERYFATFTDKPVADATKTTEVITALSVDSKDEVKRIVKAALEAGATKHKDPQDHGFMYSESFQDPDGHVWEYLWMDPSYVQK